MTLLQEIKDASVYTRSIFERLPPLDSEFLYRYLDTTLETSNLVKREMLTNWIIYGKDDTNSGYTELLKMSVYAKYILEKNLSLDELEFVYEYFNSVLEFNGSIGQHAMLKEWIGGTLGYNPYNI